MDFVVELPDSQNHTVIFVLIDLLAKMSHYMPCHKIPTTEVTADLFSYQVFKFHGCDRLLGIPRAARHSYPSQPQQV